MSQTFNIKEYLITLRDDIVEPTLAAEALVLIVRSLGRSPVSDVEMFNTHDIDSNSNKTHLRIRYIDLPGLKMCVPEDSKFVTLDRGGVNEHRR